MTLVEFESSPIKENNDPLVDLSGYDFILEPIYFKQGFMLDDKMYLRKEVADKLQEIQKNLSKYQFKIWDGYRSREVQNNIYQKYLEDLKKENPSMTNDELKNEVGKFVTTANDPNRIPPHSSGGAVDLTLVDRNSKEEINMGTDADYFGPEASSLYYEENNIDDSIKNNRKTLREAMISAGFRADKDEWWHFDYGNQLWAKELNKPFAIYGEAKTI